MAVVCFFFTSFSLFKTMLATAVVFGALTLHAVTTTRKYSAMKGGLFALSGTLFFLLFSNMFFGSPVISLLLEAGMGLLAGFYVLIDTQLIMKKDGLSLDDYMVGAIMIYGDLILLFLRLLRLFGERKKDD